MAGPELSPEQVQAAVERFDRQGFTTLPANLKEKPMRDRDYVAIGKLADLPLSVRKPLIADLTVAVRSLTGSAIFVARSLIEAHLHDELERLAAALVEAEARVSSAHAAAAAATGTARGVHTRRAQHADERAATCQREITAARCALGRLGLAPADPDA